MISPLSDVDETITPADINVAFCLCVHVIYTISDTVSSHANSTGLLWMWQKCKEKQPSEIALESKGLCNADKAVLKGQRQETKEKEPKSDGGFGYFKPEIKSLKMARDGLNKINKYE